MRLLASLTAVAFVMTVPAAAGGGVSERTTVRMDSGRTAAGVGRSWVAAVNGGDLAGAISVVAPRAVFDVGGTRYRGRAAIGRWIGGDMIAGDGRYTIVRVVPERRAAVFILDYRAGTLREALRYRFVTEQRKIVTLTARYR